MQYELAPMEGITGYIYRNAYVKYFGGTNRYYTPFIASTGLNHKELNDVLPEHNKAFLLGEANGEGQYKPRLVPQILTNKAEDFLVIADKLRQMGYSHVNLNLGCPSGTVASKGRGAGFLGHPRQLEDFLAEIYEKCPLSVSIKTRIGVADTAQWEELLRIYEKYLVEELVIHPRIQQDFYKGPIRWEGMEQALERWAQTGCGIPLCYNGELHSLAEYQSFRQRFPQIDRVMLGRGVLKNPFLAGQLREWEQEQQALEDRESEKLQEQQALEHGEAEKSQGHEDGKTRKQHRKMLWDFHQELQNGYREVMSGDQNTLFKMKELWTYLGESFPDKGKALKKLRKAGNMAQYEAAVREVFDIG